MFVSCTEVSHKGLLSRLYYKRTVVNLRSSSKRGQRRSSSEQHELFRNNPFGFVLDMLVSSGCGKNHIDLLRLVFVSVAENEIRTLRKSRIMLLY